MNATDAPLALVSAKTLDDLCELSRVAADRLPSADPLTSALRGSIAAVRASALLDPSSK